MATACDGCDETAAYRVEHTELSIQSCVLLLRRNCCERHGCEEDHCEWTLLHVAHLLYSCCEGTAAKSMAAKRTAAKRTAAKERLRMGCCEEDYGEWAAAKRTTAKGLQKTDG